MGELLAMPPFIVRGLLLSAGAAWRVCACVCVRGCVCDKRKANAAKTKSTCFYCRDLEPTLQYLRVCLYFVVGCSYLVNKFEHNLLTVGFFCVFFLTFGTI